MCGLQGRVRPLPTRGDPEYSLQEVALSKRMQNSECHGAEGSTLTKPKLLPWMTWDKPPARQGSDNSPHRSLPALALIPQGTRKLVQPLPLQYPIHATGRQQGVELEFSGLAGSEAAGQASSSAGGLHSSTPAAGEPEHGSSHPDI
jgi:hypothetical protein